MKLTVLLFFIFTTAILAQVPTYENYQYVYADGSQITLPIGNASPLVTDWNSDGKKDLLLGRFSNGNILLYTNTGTNDSPVLTYTGLLQAGGSNISLSSG
ncbi:MAG: hypothetical protein GQ565_04435 [Candidatus Aegiribacteria sp.]|nr:hypothetical protein [Candidatus Aegiribacteria sp.]